jgi:hypothetical protein
MNTARRDSCDPCCRCGLAQGDVETLPLSSAAVHMNGWRTTR